MRGKCLCSPSLSRSSHAHVAISLGPGSSSAWSWLAYGLAISGCCHAEPQLLASRIVLHPRPRCAPAAAQPLWPLSPPARMWARLYCMESSPRRRVCPASLSRLPRTAAVVAHGRARRRRVATYGAVHACFTGHPWLIAFAWVLSLTLLHPAKTRTSQARTLFLYRHGQRGRPIKFAM